MVKKKKKSEVIEVPSRTSKEEKLFQNLLKIVQQFMQGKGFVSLSEGELMQRLGLPPQHASLFHDVLQALLEQGAVELSKGRYCWKKADHVDVDVVKGVLRVHPRGFGFLQPYKTDLFPQDIFIPKHLTQNAVDGDIVEVQVNTDVVSEKGPEGKVVAILSRGRTHMAGIVRAIEHGEITAYVPLLGTAQRVVVKSNSEFDLRVGDRIVMEVVDWGEKDTETVCRVSHYIGHISDPSCDIKAAIEEYELRSDFPAAVVKEAQSLGRTVSRKDILDREDLRQLECFTIDPDTAKDFDDALTLSKDSQGCYHLGVHIADVSHYVRLGSALDEEAQLRCNSTYFPGVCIPMLPGELSENLCSLKAAVNRLTVSVFIDFDPEGNMVNYRIGKTVIKSSKRFTYRQAKEVLDGTKKSRHLPTLKLMVELCGLLKRKRYERGSIEFSIPELVVIVDDKGVPQKTDYIAYDITHQLVEEFMLKANEVVALHLSRKGKNLTYRIHDVPAEENMRDFSVLAGAFGFQLSETPTPRELQSLFDEALQTSFGQYLATSYIRRMRLAAYSADNIGHYGLGLTHYCHFTSPIRRYVDLVVHRILFNESDDRADIEKICLLSSEQERISAKAENHVVLLKKLRLLNTIHEKEPQKQYEAIVTRIKNFGLFFEVLDFMLEGFLHVSKLDNDYFVYEETNARLRGVRHGINYCSGDKITVMLRSVDFILLESEWNLVSDQKGRELSEGRESQERRRFQRPHKHKKDKKPVHAKTKSKPHAKTSKLHAKTSKPIKPKDIKEPKDKIPKVKKVKK